MTARTVTHHSIIYLIAFATIVSGASADFAGSDIRFEKPSSVEIALIKAEINDEPLIRPFMPEFLAGGARGILKMIQNGEVYYLVASESEGGGGNCDCGNFYIFRNTGGTLETVFQKNGGEGAVYGYDFADLYGDGTTEVIVSYRTGGTIGNAAEIYCLNGGFKSVLKEGFTYNSIEIADMPAADGKKDGADEIAVGCRDSGKLSYEVYRLKDDKLTQARDVYPYFFGRLCREIEKSIADPARKHKSRVVLLCALAEAQFMAGWKKKALATFKKAEKAARAKPDDYSATAVLCETRRLLEE